jgi:hypothetical protein
MAAGIDEPARPRHAVPLECGCNPLIRRAGENEEREECNEETDNSSEAEERSHRSARAADINVSSIV